MIMRKKIDYIFYFLFGILIFLNIRENEEEYEYPSFNKSELVQESDHLMNKNDSITLKYLIPSNKLLSKNDTGFLTNSDSLKNKKLD